MLMRLFKSFVLLVLFLEIAIPCYAANSAYNISPQIPLNSWTYPALDRVVALCQVKTGLSGTRPLTRLEAARLISEASLKAALYAVPLQVKILLKRLETEFHAELAYLAAEPGEDSMIPSKLLRAAEVSYTYQDGKDSVATGTDAHQFALNYNNAGIDYDNYNNGTFSLMGDTVLFNHLLLSWQPLVRTRDDHGTDVTTKSAVAALSYGGIELSGGRQSLWWGPGRHGSLILTNNAKPLDMVRLTNPSPFELPWIFKYLGPFRFDLFASRLENDRDVPKPYFTGLRLNVKPAYWLEIGATRTIMLGGKGEPNVDFGDFLTILTGENLNGSNDNSNSLAGIDAKLIFPLLWGVEIYGELVGEDEAGGFFSRNSYMVGAFLPQVDPSGILSLRVEYADTTRIGGDSPVLYRHGLYTSGYTYEEHIMGHHVGTDATDLSLLLGIDVSARLSLSLGFDYEERGKSQNIQEKHAQGDINATWWLSPKLSLSAGYAYDHVKNWNFEDGNENFQLATLAIAFQF
jgi:hypothetical protein